MTFNDIESKGFQKDSCMYICDEMKLIHIWTRIIFDIFI